MNAFRFGWRISLILAALGGPASLGESSEPKAPSSAKVFPFPTAQTFTCSSAVSAYDCATASNQMASQIDKCLQTALVGSCASVTPSDPITSGCHEINGLALYEAKVVVNCPAPENSLLFYGTFEAGKVPAGVYDDYQFYCALNVGTLYDTQTSDFKSEYFSCFLHPLTSDQVAKLKGGADPTTLLPSAPTALASPTPEPTALADATPNPTATPTSEIVSYAPSPTPTANLGATSVASPSVTPVALW